MPSEFAKTLNFELDARAPQRRSVEVIDVELQEVREVLEGLMTRKWFGNKPTRCWCDPRALPDSDDDADQDIRCQLARALYRRLTPTAQEEK